MALGGSNVTASMIDESSLDDIAGLKVVDQRALQIEIEKAEALWKARREALQAALDIKYGARATELRHGKGQDTGTVNIADDTLSVACELRKKVEWDQPQCEALWQRIAAAKDDPRVYMKLEYKISETAFNGWPANIKTAFEPARTVKPEKPKYIISDPADKGKK